jgi:flagellar basal-body rod protein FlgB
MPELQYRHPVQPSIDGNTVEMDAEVGRFSDNAMRYQASMTFASHTIRELRAAIQGQ